MLSLFQPAVFSSRSLVTASNSADSSASSLTSLVAGSQLLVCPKCPPDNISARPAQKTPFIVVLYRFRGNTTARESDTQQWLRILDY
jgi:hypothetical protein